MVVRGVLITSCGRFARLTWKRMHLNLELASAATFVCTATTPPSISHSTPYLKHPTVTFARTTSWNSEDAFLLFLMHVELTTVNAWQEPSLVHRSEQ